MSILVIAEKPSVARDIARVLSCSGRGDGFLYGENYIVSWALGHLAGPADPEDYNVSYKKWSFNTLPIIPEKIKLKILSKTKKQFLVLKKLMNAEDTSEIICATDSGREGELIFRYIYESAGCKKPFKRLWISSMTDTAIKKGFDSLKDGCEYDNLYKSAKCRSEADWLVGINASRAYTITYGVLLTIGRVQTPTLSLLVAKKKEIEAFKPEKYWEVTAEFGVLSKGGYKGTWFEPETNETKITSAEKADEIVSLVKGKDGKVVSVNNEDKKTPPPLLFDLTELQRECNRKYGMSAKKTLDVAQSLYEKYKLITYPRTDSRYLTEDMKSGIKKVLESFQGKLAELAAYPLGLGVLPVTKRIIDDKKVTDHHAIIPTGKTAASLPEAEGKVFDLIARRLIAAFYPDYTYSVTKIVTIAENESFLSKGLTVLNPGWASVLGREQKEADVVLPTLAVGDTYKISSVKSAEKMTSPPKPYTEATLLSAMEHAGRFVDDEELKEQLKESGLGTPATRAAIIERLIQVGYVKREKKSLIATDKGEKIIEIVPTEMKSPETTAKWERALSSISKGKMETDRFNGSIKKYVRYIVGEAKTAKSGIVFESEDTISSGKSAGRKSTSLGKCPLCGGEVHENTKAFFCSKWKSGCAFTLWKNALEKSGASLTPDIVKKLLKNNKIDNFPVLLTSTRESGTCTLALDTRTDGFLNILNFNRKEG